MPNATSACSATARIWTASKPPLVASAIVAAAMAKGLSLQMPSRVHEIAGAGLEGIVDGKRVRAGSHQLIFGSHRSDDWALRALRRASWRSALSVFVSIDGRIAGALLLGDELRRETPRAIQSLRAAGVARIVMVTGDRADAAETIAAALDIDAVLSDRDPVDKVDAVAMESRLHPTLMVGDGINDAPALAAADLGIPVGGGTDAALKTAGIALMRDDPRLVPEAIRIARATLRKIRENLAFAFIYNVAAIPLAALGFLTPVIAGAAMALSSVSVVTNALLLRRLGRATRRA